jgi:hypothetical protein
VPETKEEISLPSEFKLKEPAFSLPDEAPAAEGAKLVCKDEAAAEAAGV